MATASPALVRAALPIARSALAAARGGRVRGLLAVADSALQRTGGHPAMPAAVRIERARSSGGGTSSDQTAVTLWFGEGPALPSPGGSTVRSAARLGAGVVATVALAALTAVAARREQERVIDAPARRLQTAPGQPGSAPQS